MIISVTLLTVVKEKLINEREIINCMYACICRYFCSSIYVCRFNQLIMLLYNLDENFNTVAVNKLTIDHNLFLT